MARRQIHAVEFFSRQVVQGHGHHLARPLNSYFAEKLQAGVGRLAPADRDHACALCRRALSRKRLTLSDHFTFIRDAICSALVRCSRTTGSVLLAKAFSRES